MNNTKLNFNFFLTDLEGKEVESWHAGKLLASTLGTNGDSKEPVKLAGWAMALHKKEEITLDRTDLETLKAFIVSSNMYALVRAQLINYIDDAKTEQSKEKKTEEKKVSTERLKKA